MVEEKTETEVSWKVSIDTISERGYDLDIKNPNKKVVEVNYNRADIISTIKTNQNSINQLIAELEQ